MVRRTIAYVLMGVGFWWIAGKCLGILFTADHTLWVWHSQTLTTGDMIPRSDAIDQMRKLQLAIRHEVLQPLVIPAVLMLAGGILNGVQKKRTQNQASDATSEPAPSADSSSHQG